jgi:DNA-3-methyladenine glycosylase I
MMKKRCAWCDESSEIYCHYHDNQWGVPVYDEQELYEMLILEGMQAGLSWLTILKKRKNFRLAFDHFDYQKVAIYDDEKIAQLLDNQGIVRNRLKIRAAIKNAQIFLNIQKEFGSFKDYIWAFVDFNPIQNQFERLEEIPAQTELSEKISKDLKRRGMNFVGPTIIYSFMQAIGMVNDHVTSCFRHKEVYHKKIYQGELMSHIDIEHYVKQTLPVIISSDVIADTIELYATRLLNELMSRRMSSEQAIKMVADYKQLVKQQMDG